MPTRLISGMPCQRSPIRLRSTDAPSSTSRRIRDPNRPQGTRIFRRSSAHRRFADSDAEAGTHRGGHDRRRLPRGRRSAVRGRCTPPPRFGGRQPAPHEYSVAPGCHRCHSGEEQRVGAAPGAGLAPRTRGGRRRRRIRRPDRRPRAAERVRWPRHRSAPRDGQGAGRGTEHRSALRRNSVRGVPRLRRPAAHRLDRGHARPLQRSRGRTRRPENRGARTRGEHTRAVRARPLLPRPRT